MVQKSLADSFGSGRPWKHLDMVAQSPLDMRAEQDHSCSTASQSRGRMVPDDIPHDSLGSTAVSAVESSTGCTSVWRALRRFLTQAQSTFRHLQDHHDTHPSCPSLWRKAF